MSEPLEFTGERFTPECVREIWYEHIHRYVFASHYISGLNVLDAACGEGYGSALLAKHAQAVTGVDISLQAVTHARQRYASQQNLEFTQADCCDLPFEDNAFDCVVSFETLEHLENQQGLLAEFRRVLKPKGFLILSSPDKAEYSDVRGFDNEFHVKELYKEELTQLLDQHFPAYRMLGQKLQFQSAIWSLDNQRRGQYQQDQYQGNDIAKVSAHKPMYFIALCAATEDCLPALDQQLWLFDDQEESVYDHYHHEIRKNMAAGGILIERDKEIKALKAKLAESEAKTASWWRRWFGR